MDPLFINSGKDQRCNETMAEIVDKKLVRYHVCPDFDGEPEHDITPRCWCSPKLDLREEDDEEREEIWVHNRVN